MRRRSEDKWELNKQVREDQHCPAGVGRLSAISSFQVSHYKNKINQIDNQIIYDFSSMSI